MSRSIYLGLFFIALATLMYELLLTRIFSVTMYYHFAFMAVSTAMFGMTLGAMLLYVFPALQETEGLFARASKLSLFCALSVVVSLFLHIALPPGNNPILQSLSTAFTYACVSVPFIFGGMLISLLFKSYNEKIGRLYAADLCGAAAGCLLLVTSLNLLDGFSAVLFVAFWACVAASCFATSCPRQFRLAVYCTTLALGVCTLAHSYLFNNDLPGAVRIYWVKGEYVEKPLYEKWNSFSRVTVWGDLTKPLHFYYPGISSAYRFTHPSKGLNLEIDGCARTTMVGFDGDYSKLDFLRYNASNLVYQLKKNADVLIIGSGGGYDLVSALALGAKSVEAVDINNNIIAAVNDKFGDFTGHLDKLPNVKFVNDEARSHITRSNKHFDIIEMSFIDTWAATASGAYVLTENALYTVEGWDVFLSHLSPQGIFSVSRWYERKTPAEMYRLTALAAESLRRQKVADPRKHMVIIRNIPATTEKDGPDGVGIMLVSRSPFTKNQLSDLKNLCEPLGFEIILSPNTSIDPMFTQLAGKESPLEVYKNFPLNIAPPTDDSPFFFNMMRLENAYNHDLKKQFSYTFNLQAVATLLGLVLSSIGFSYLCIYLPLRFAKEKYDFNGAGPFMLYFLCIGVGFMFVEISQIQRCIVFLGHPVYGITVVLFTLLVASGIGSYFSERISTPLKTVAALPISLILYGLASPYLFELFRGAETSTRLAVAMALLAVIGFFMGCAFPAGIKACAQNNAKLIPLYWGINGAGSVCGSVLALLVSIVFGISTLFWLGVVVYIMAFISLFGAKKGSRSV
ncbi:MAG: hypothetical protein K2W82_15415 [Candidatus Obscuribacterales bacterium]|nr:hypothetical protein [Candidatus Obscuribacterales bacterium]